MIRLASIVTSILVLVLFRTATAVAEAKVFFMEPKENATVGTSFHVKMGAEGVKLCPANQETADKTCGHHHILLDSKFIPEGQPIANDPNHLHFGKGQMETEVKLTPGKHTLTLQFADFAHRSFGEKLSQTITVNVK